MNKLKNWTLLTHLAIAFTVTLAVMIITAGWWVKDLEKEDIDQHRAHMNQVYSAIALATLEAVITEDRGVLKDVINRAVPINSKIMAVMIRNEEGHILAEWAQNGVNDSQEMASFYEDYIYLGERFGSIEIQWDMGAIIQAANVDTFRLQKLLTLLLFIMAGLTGLWVYWLLVKPINKISVYLDGLRRDKLQTPLTIAFPQEISLLAKAVNKLDQLLLSHKDRERDLERRVEQRTVELKHQAQHDSLTGLYNRAAFEECLESLLAQFKDSSSTHALLYIDLDQFKVVNDSCGHAAGDQLLKQLSEALQLHIRKSDYLARMGGDEFTLLLMNCTLENAQRRANKILEGIKGSLFHWDKQVFSISASIGIATITAQDNCPKNIMNRADMACYMAKELGRNRVEIFQDTHDELHSLRKEMLKVPEIQKALKEDRLVLYFQEISPVDPGQADGWHFEILVRMLNSDGAIVPPGAFLPTAERFNLMACIDRFVISKTLDFLSQPQIDIDQVSLCSINISGQSFYDDDFFGFLIEQLTDLPFPRHKLCFEITETVAISNIAKVKTLMTRMKEMGCRFALDDFGSGMSSFAYLKHLPIDFIKIDGMFVKNMVTDHVDHIMVASINEIGHALGIQTIAEYVEDDTILHALKSIGVDFAQGFGIAKPRPLSQLELNQNVPAITPSSEDAIKGCINGGATLSALRDS